MDFRHCCYPVCPTLGGFAADTAVKNLLDSVGDVRVGVQPLVLEDPLEEGTATHSSVLAWKTPETEEPGGLESKGSQRVGPD